jgi:hypothetical protein
MNRFAIGAALGALMVVCTSSGVHAAPPGRSLGSGGIGLELDGTAVGLVTVVQGGNAVGNVVKEPAGEDPFVKKHLGNVGYHDIVIQFGADMAPAVFDWIGLALQRQYAPKNGAIVMLDFSRRARSRLEFTGAQITEVTFPSADAASRDTVKFTVRLTPLQTTLNRNPPQVVFGGSQSRPASVRENAFSFTINGIAGLQNVTKVEQITVTLPWLVDPALVCSICEPVPTPPIDFPTVSFTLAEAQAESVYQWLGDFVLNGNNDDAAERSGALNFVVNGSARFTLNFSHLGIFEIAAADTDATSNSIATLKVSTYCEQIAFAHSGAS